MESKSVEASAEFHHCNNLKVRVSVDCLQSGDSALTRFTLVNTGGTVMGVAIDGCDERPADVIEIRLRGNAEYLTFVKALEFALSALKVPS
jgi:hypothetical protein